MQIKATSLAVALCASPLLAQQQGSPLSAIDWLAVQRDTVPLIVPPSVADEDPVAQTATVPDVDVQPLDAPSISGVGLLPTSVTGLPADLWRGSDEADLIAAITRFQSRDPAVPALDVLFHTLMLAEAPPPTVHSGERLLLARIDALYAHGLVAAAEAMLERTGTLTPELFEKAFDLALLIGSDMSLCALLDDQPNLSTDLSIRIWCATRDGDYPRAMTVFQTGEALDELSELDAGLLLRFLDPDYAETATPLRPPVRPTPLQFRLFEAIGEALPTAALPRPFAVVELTGDSGWRAQLQAAERLSRAGAIDGNQLLGVYTSQQPAASGGIWDRVEALQAFDAALVARDPDAVATALETVWPQMRSAGLLVPFSGIFAERLQELSLTGRAARLAKMAGLLSTDYEATALTLAETSDPDLAFLAAIARGEAPARTPSSVPHGASLAAAWAQPAVAPEELAGMAARKQLGEALLAALSLFDSGADGNGADLTSALRSLRAFGLEDTARRAALQLAILDMEGARR